MRAMLTRVLSIVAVAQLLLATLALATLPHIDAASTGLGKPVLAGSREAEEGHGRRKRPDLSPYRGLGAWIDMYDDWPWADPTGSVEDMKRHGVRTLFLQTSNYLKRGAFFNRRAIEEFIEAAHARHMKVVAWYVPSFVDLERDFQRIKAAILLRTSGGHRFDSFALDIEDDSVYPVSLRNKRLFALTAMMRKLVGSGYALGAIVPDPIRFDAWPRFPYAAVARRYDVVVPMQYFSEWTSGYDGALAHIAEGLRRMRAETGDRTPIHVIGGIASRVDSQEMSGFVKALRQGKVFGFSLYDFPITQPGHWSSFAGLHDKGPRKQRARDRPRGPSAKASTEATGAPAKPPALPTLPTGKTVSQLLHPSLRR